MTEKAAPGKQRGSQPEKPTSLQDLVVEALDRRGYQEQPQQPYEYGNWENVAAWPED